jgi:hypothetical protein
MAESWTRQAVETVTGSLEQKIACSLAIATYHRRKIA